MPRCALGSPVVDTLLLLQLHQHTMAPPAVTTAAPTSSGKKRKAHDDADAQQENSSHKQQQMCDAEPSPHPQPIQNEYELQRQQRIERNRQIMQELGVEQAAAAVRQSMNSSKRQRTANKKKVRQQWRQVWVRCMSAQRLGLCLVDLCCL